jgi:hypothetical protein
VNYRACWREIRVGDRVIFDRDIAGLPAWSSGVVVEVLDKGVRVQTGNGLFEVDPEVLVREDPVKRFVLFQIYDYYPEGGWNDFVGSFDSAQEAFETAGNLSGDGWHVVDMRAGVVVRWGRK